MYFIVNLNALSALHVALVPFLSIKKGYIIAICILYRERILQPSLFYLVVSLHWNVYCFACPVLLLYFLIDYCQCTTRRELFHLLSLIHIWFVTYSSDSSTLDACLVTATVPRCTYARLVIAIVPRRTRDLWQRLYHGGRVTCDSDCTSVGAWPWDDHLA